MFSTSLSFFCYICAQGAVNSSHPLKMGEFPCPGYMKPEQFKRIISAKFPDAVFETSRYLPGVTYVSFGKGSCIATLSFKDKTWGLVGIFMPNPDDRIPHISSNRQKDLELMVNLLGECEYKVHPNADRTVRLVTPIAMWIDDCDPEDTPWNYNNELADAYLELKERGLTAPVKCKLDF